MLGLASVPDGLPAGLLAGLNPLAGLYAYLVGTLAGSLSTSSVFMCVQATGAMAVVISDIPQVRGQPDPAAALATLRLLTGAIMLLAVYGSLFFASARVVEVQLPQVEPESVGAVVLLRLRGTEDLCSTFIQAMLRYSTALRQAGCELVLAGVGQRVPRPAEAHRRACRARVGQRLPGHRPGEEVADLGTGASAQAARLTAGPSQVLCTRDVATGTLRAPAWRPEAVTRVRLGSRVSQGSRGR